MAPGLAYADPLRGSDPLICDNREAPCIRLGSDTGDHLRLPDQTSIRRSSGYQQLQVMLYVLTGFDRRMIENLLGKELCRREGIADFVARDPAISVTVSGGPAR